jgi:hypothetical protein
MTGQTLQVLPLNVPHVASTSLSNCNQPDLLQHIKNVPLTPIRMEAEMGCTTTRKCVPGHVFTQFTVYIRWRWKYTSRLNLLYLANDVHTIRYRPRKCTPWLRMGGDGGTAPYILNLGIKRGLVISFTPWQLYPRGKNPSYSFNRRLKWAP